MSRQVSFQESIWYFALVSTFDSVFYIILRTLTLFDCQTFYSTFRNTEECLKNNHPDVFNFVPVQTCLDDGIFIESCKGNVVEVSEFGNNECSGPKPSHMGKKRFYPNSNDVCHGIEDGHQTNQPFSMKCANNHLYKH